MVVSLLGQPSPSYAASGGRIGGGSFRAPSVPRGGSGSYGGGGYGGYRGGYGSYRGGGMGFPFILPIFGFGGGGLFGFLILMSIAGVIVNSIKGGLNAPTIEKSRGLTQPTQGPVTLIQLQIGLLANAKELQSDLRDLAASANTSTSIGLQQVLQETTLSLLRQPSLWVYANLENGQVPFNSAESTFNRLSLTERSKLSKETTSNFSGQIIANNTSTSMPGDADATNEYIAVTLVIASKRRENLSETNNSEQLRNALRSLGSISSKDLMALEVIWQPDGQGDVLSAEELVTAYPNLKHL
nr:DUF1517 domain-containing protein [Prochlorococcus sp. MIT 1307]